MTNPSKPVEKLRKDYRAPDFAFDSVQLQFDLHQDHTIVRARIEVSRVGDPVAPLALHGEELNLEQVCIDGRELEPADYQADGEILTLLDVPDAFVLSTRVRIDPAANTALSGLYKSSGVYCTQCEAEGFRRITYFQDRPDVMTVFRVRIEADRQDCPVLLSNGNLVESGDLGGGRHFAVWDDPFKKPSYLFALVAGDLGHVHGTFTTMGGTEVDLYVYSEHENVDRLDHSLECLESAMKWDEEAFGREYDLNIYNIVAVNDFNMGAMENKSLNVFNSGRVLASPDTATDGDYEVIDGVVAHEYFHNWTGNRVTCRDWFQLTLKEGLTVFRDQHYSADMTSAAVKRIEDVRILRGYQFPEDAGPMAHPIRPESYIAMDNFYTVTVYDKGAEVIRLYHTLLGADGFRKGMDLYFERHDGQAVTCDDFRAAMADANGADLTQVELWYLQAGTPVVRADGSWDEAAQTYTLTLEQSCPATPGQPTKEPFHIPVACGLLDADGNDLIGTRVLDLREARQEFVFDGVATEPVPSLLRNFSAPVKLRMDHTDDQLAFLLAHDSAAFNRWEAGQKLGTRVALGLVDDLRAGRDLQLSDRLVDAFRQTLRATDLDQSLQSYALRLPGERTLGEEMDVVLPHELHAARKFAVETLAEQLRDDWLAVYEREAPIGPYRYSPAEAGRRRMRNLSLGYLSALETDETVGLCERQYETADNMTDQLSALACLASIPGDACDRALAAFYEQWKHVALVVDKWLSVQAGADRDDVLERVDDLRNHPAYDVRNPNKVRALVRVFFRNQAAFHVEGGAGYRWVADRILELDELNPQMSARTADAFTPWRRFDAAPQALMKEQLERIAAREGISKNLFEIVSKSLAS